MRKFPVFYNGKDYLVTTDGGVYNFDNENCICDLISIDENERIIVSAWSGESKFPIEYKDKTNYLLNRDNLYWKIVSKEIINDDMICINGIVFKKIIGFSHYYIADGGLIYSTFYDKIMHHKINKANYHVISLVDDTGRRRMMPVHRMLWYTWNNKVPDDNMEINHIDGKEWHCWLWNLEEITPLENHRHAAYSINTKEYTWTIDQIHTICKLLSSGVPIRAIYDNNSWINSNIGLSGFKILAHHLIHKTKFWVEISSQYDFSKYQKANTLVSDDDVRKICVLLEKGYKAKEISLIMNLDIKFISSIKCRSSRTSISKDYKF